MGWHASLRLDYGVQAQRTVARFAHDGPLRILQSLWPEGDAICHNVLVHPPGGLVGGDTLDIAVSGAAGSHGLVTTPGAARFYRSDGEPAIQRTRISLAAGARIEWVPLEAIYFPGCIAENHLALALEPGAELMGWDVAALGLPQAGQPFERGRILQHIELEDAWLERARIDAADTRLMDGPLGLAGQRCMATAFFACGAELGRARREAALEAARGVIDARAAEATGGATAPGPRVVVVRVLAPMVEPAMRVLRAVRLAWRGALWGLGENEPRGWHV